MPRIGVPIPGIEFNRAPDESERAGIVVPVGPMMQDLRLQNALVGSHVRGRLALCTAARVGLKAARQRCDNGRGDLVLNREYVLHIPIIAFRPDVMVGLGLD